MLAVSNTSPISNLASIGRLQLLKEQLSAVWIPDSVFAELSAHPDPAAQTVIKTAIREQWIQIRSVHDSDLVRVLQLQLHRGEAESIALAREIDADIVLIDEQEGRQSASRIGLAVTGVLGILLRAKRTDEISSIKSELERLRSKAHFYVSSTLEAKVLAAAGE